MCACVRECEHVCEYADVDVDKCIYVCLCVHIYTYNFFINTMYYNLFLLLNVLSRSIFCDFKSLLRNHFA